MNNTEPQEKVTNHLTVLAQDIGKAEAGRYLSHILLQDTSFTCTDDTKKRLIKFGSSVREDLGDVPVGPWMFWAAEQFLKNDPECIPVNFENALKHLKETDKPSRTEAAVVKEQPKVAEEPHWPYVSWVDDTAAGYALALAGSYRTFVKADKLPEAVRSAVENIIQAAAIGKTERVLMVDSKQGNKITKALQGLGFTVQNTKCKNGKCKLTVTYE